MISTWPVRCRGKSVFEAQALHSDGQWDATVYRLPIHTGRFFWQTPVFRWSAGIGIVLLAAGLGVLLTRRRAGPATRPDENGVGAGR